MSKCYENYVLVDIGANLSNKKFSRDLESVICRAKDAGVQKMIVSSSSIKGSKESLRLSQIYPGTLYAAAGVHPHEARSWEEGSLNELRSISSGRECVAIGECGLDYNKSFTQPDIQRDVFRKQIELACELQKPLLVHEKEAHDDLVNILEEFKNKLPPVVLHSFTGTSTQALKYLDMGLYLGITGFICKDNSENGIKSLLEKGSIPLDRVMVQSDSPFMYPNARASKLPVRVKEALTERSMAFLNRYCTFQRNEPCSLPAIVEILAALLNKSPEDVAVASAFNALKVFDFK